jgi:hypothetical protein
MRPSHGMSPSSLLPAWHNMVFSLLTQYIIVQGSIIIISIIIHPRVSYKLIDVVE